MTSKRSSTQQPSYRLETDLRQTIYTYNYITRLIRSTGGMITTCQMRGWDSSAIMLSSFYARLVETKDVYAKALRVAVKDHPMSIAAKDVWGIGPVTLFSLLYWIDWSACPTPASLWSYCGVAVVDGKSQYKARVFGADTTWSIGANSAYIAARKKVVDPRSPYRRVLIDRLAYERDMSLLPENICYKRAKRYTGKLWLRHLWVVGRTVHGLPVGTPHPRTPYPDPLEFGWRMGN